MLLKAGKKSKITRGKKRRYLEVPSENMAGRGGGIFQIGEDCTLNLKYQETLVEGGKRAVGLLKPRKRKRTKGGISPVGKVREG